MYPSLGSMPGFLDNHLSHPPFGSSAIAPNPPSLAPPPSPAITPSPFGMSPEYGDVLCHNRKSCGWGMQIVSSTLTSSSTHHTLLRRDPHVGILAPVHPHCSARCTQHGSAHRPTATTHRPSSSAHMNGDKGKIQTKNTLYPNAGLWCHKHHGGIPSIDGVRWAVKV